MRRNVDWFAVCSDLFKTIVCRLNVYTFVIKLPNNKLFGRKIKFIIKAYMYNKTLVVTNWAVPIWASVGSALETKADPEHVSFLEILGKRIVRGVGYSVCYEEVHCYIGRIGRQCGGFFGMLL